MVGTRLSLKHFKTPPPHLDAPFALYPVSILKPLKGTDEGLEENLKSFFKLNYPDFEILFSVADERDPAASVVKKLMRHYPRVCARLIVGYVDAGPNPKVNNMIKSYDQAKHDWILISDSNVRVEKNYVKRLVAHLDPSVGMVTAAVAGRNSEGLGGALESVYLNTFYARGMIITDRLGHPCVIGKSMLFRRSVAARFGGIQTLARYLAEDYMAGQAMGKLGLRVVIASDPVVQIIGKYKFKEFWSRHIRWGRIRKTQAPIPFLYEPFTNAIVSGVLGAFGLHQLFGFPVHSVLLVHLSVWAFCDILLMKKLKTEVGFFLPLYWFMRELLALPLWIHIASGNTVSWRGSRLRLETGGILAATPVTR